MIAPMGITPQVARELHGYESTNPEPGSLLPLPFDPESGNRPTIEPVPFSSVPTRSSNLRASQVQEAVDCDLRGPRCAHSRRFSHLGPSLGRSADTEFVPLSSSTLTAPMWSR